MSEEVKVRIDNIGGLFFKALWIIVGYFVIDLHSGMKEHQRELDEIHLDYHTNKAVMEWRVKTIEDNDKRSRIKTINPTNDNAGRDPRDSGI